MSIARDIPSRFGTTDPSAHGRSIGPMSRNVPAAPPFELVAIDLDGTLVDTIADLHAAVLGMQDALGQARASEDATRARVGNGIERLVHRTLTGATGLAGAPDPDAEPGTFERGLAAFRAAYDGANGTRSTLYPGVADELDRLAAAGVPVVVVTNKAGRYSRPLLDALGVSDRVAGHVAGDEVAAKKPAPDALLAAARLVGATPARSLMVGDSISDVRAARAAGFAVACTNYGYNHGVPVRELAGADAPDAVIDSFAELEGVMARLGAGAPRR